MPKHPLELHHEGTAAVTASVRLSQPTTPVWILLVALALGTSVLWLLDLTSNGAAVGVAWGALGSQLVITLWLKPISVRASVSDDTITIERLARDVVGSAQTMNRSSAGRFELKVPPRLFGVAIHPVHNLHFDGHRVRLPLTFLLRSEELCDEWNRLLDAIPGDSVSA